MTFSWAMPKDQAFTVEQGGLGEWGSSMVSLRWPFEVDERDVAVLGELLEGGDELTRHVAEQLVAGERLAAVLAEEPGELVGLLELGDVTIRCDG